MAFYDDDHLLVSSAFRGLISLPSAPPALRSLVPDDAPSMRLLAASPQAVAYVTEGRLSYSQRNQAAIDTAAWNYNAASIAIAIGLYLLTLFGAIFALGRLSGPKAKTATVGEPPHPEPVAPPPRLVATIRSGASVLVSGSQLASFAGLPDRRGLLEEFVAEAAAKGYVTTEALADYLRAADAGKYALVFDELIATVPSAALEAIVRTGYS